VQTACISWEAAGCNQFRISGHRYLWLGKNRDSLKQSKITDPEDRLLGISGMRGSCLIQQGHHDSWEPKAFSLIVYMMLQLFQSW